MKTGHEKRSYDPRAIEKKWQDQWARTVLYRTPDPDGRRTFYCLDFFPYPSGAGLSVGHCRNYVPTDVISRYHRMKGDAVLHPMGWDAFGLPAENEAIDKGVHPRDSTQRYAANYKRQMQLVGASYDWEREINSSDPDYYRWTQWIFLLLYERGLAYRAKAPVTWCETCQTSLASEEVEQGACWRCHNPVTRRNLEQWFFRITAYADELLEDTEHMDWPEHILTMQRNWIGRREGVEFEMRVAGHAGAAFRVFTTRPDTVYGMTFAVLAPEHGLVGQITAPDRVAKVKAYCAQVARSSEIERLSTEGVRHGVFTGAHAINPVNDDQVPIFVADYVLPGYVTGAIMAVPAHDQRDFAFAQRYALPVVRVIHPARDQEALEGDARVSRAYEGEGTLVNSGDFGGLPSAEAQQAIIGMMEKEGYGRRSVEYRLRDWLISRQRYWGVPIPIVHCELCGIVPVPREDLPVLLPHMPDYRPKGDGQPPLGRVDEFAHTICPDCGGEAHRETDTMGGFACSSWYFLRYCNPGYTQGPFDPVALKEWLPVDLYVGGAEHAVMHLLYARFWTKVLADAGLLDFREPFASLRSQGVLHARDGKRMSKSQRNVVTPDEVVGHYGADVLRCHLLFMAPFDRDVVWGEDGILGVQRFLQRVWSLCLAIPTGDLPEGQPALAAAERLRRVTHRTIRRVTKEIESFKFNTAVAALMEFTNTMNGYRSENGSTNAFDQAARSLLLLLAPFVPHISEELWQRRGGSFSVHQQPWPTYDPALTSYETVTVVVQVNGKVRDRIQVPAGASDESTRRLALDSPMVRNRLQGRPPERVIVVPNRLVNVVM